MISLVKKKCSTYFLDNQFCKGYLDPPGGKFRKEALVLQSVDNAEGKVEKSTLTCLIIVQQILFSGAGTGGAGGAGGATGPPNIWQIS